MTPGRRDEILDVVEPKLGDLSPKPEDFLRAWHQMGQYRRQIEIMLTPAADVIKKRFLQKYSPSVLWDQTELSTRDEINYDVIISIDFYFPGSGETDQDAYTLPLPVALGGVKAINDFFDEEKKKEIAEAERQGLLRLAREKNDRQKLFETLKKEFDPDGTQGKEVKEDKAEASYPGGVVPV